MRWCFFACGLFLLISCGGSRSPVQQRPNGPAAGVPPRRLRLTILSTNDFHGQLEPLRRYTNEESPRPYRVGGAEALAATIAELRASDPEGTVLLDAGDFMQGSLLSNHYEGAPVREVFALLRYDAAAVGNHEFDYGPVGVPDPPPDSGMDPRGALRAWCSRAPFPVLSANLRDKDGTPPAWKNLRPSVLIKRRGISIGLIGLTTPETAVTTMPSFAAGLRFEPWLPSVRREATALRSRGAELVILLAHGNAECPLPDPGSCRGELFSDVLDKMDPGLIDVVVAGHSHQLIAHRYGRTLVAEACSRSQAVGRIEVFFDAHTRRFIPSESRPLPPVHVCHDVFAKTGDCEEPVGEPGPTTLSPLLAKQRLIAERVRRVLAPYKDGVADASRRVLARAARPLLHRRAPISETGTFFAAALLRTVPRADAALFNGGSVRSELPSGEIHYADLYEAFPFENHLSIVRLTGAELTQVVKILLTRYGMPLVAGMQLHLRCGPPRKLLAVLDGRGRPVQSAKLYTVALSDFLVTGGDGVGPILGAVPASRKRIFREKLIRELIAADLERRRAPLNSAATPVVSAQKPPLVFEDGPCPMPAQPRQGFCR